MGSCGTRETRNVTTVFLDARLSKTKYPRKRFQNFRQSYMLSTDRIEIHQWPDLHCRRMIRPDGSSVEKDHPSSINTEGL